MDSIPKPRKPQIKKGPASPQQLLGKLLLFLLILSLLFLLTDKWGWFSQNLLKQANLPLSTAIVSLDKQSIKVELASDDASQYRGLSYRPSLCPNCGMLFVFSSSTERDFVMRNMKFPLDIIFINQGRITKIDASLPPEGNKPQVIYASDGPVDQVLELNAGYAAEHNFKIGDRMTVSAN